MSAEHRSAEKRNFIVAKGIDYMLRKKCKSLPAKYLRVFLFCFTRIVGLVHLKSEIAPAKVIIEYKSLW